MAVKAVFHGTDEEAYAMQVAIGHNCECRTGPFGMHPVVCGAHREATESQWFLNTALFYRRHRAMLIAEESAGG